MRMSRRRAGWAILLCLCSAVRVSAMEPADAASRVGREIATTAGRVVTYPAPAECVPAPEYTVRVAGHEVFVHDQPTAAFCHFSCAGAVDVVVQARQDIRRVDLRPARLGVKPEIDGPRVRFTLPRPAHVSVEIDGDEKRPLLVFASPLEENPPREGDPKVLYFAPGKIHELGKVSLEAGQTVYIAGGAVVRAMFVSYQPDVKILGRGILEAGVRREQVFWMVGAHNLHLEGLVVASREPNWTTKIFRSRGVRLRNLKIVNPANCGDGIDLCGCQDARVEDCFIQTKDDCISVKGNKWSENEPVDGLRIERCVLWNTTWGCAFRLGGETQAPYMRNIAMRDCDVLHADHWGGDKLEGVFNIHVAHYAEVSDVLFADCDVIHDKGREWTLRVYHCDSATVSNIRFENIRVEESKRLISAWIGKAVWSRDAERGHIRDVDFRNINASGDPLRVELKGFDAQHQVEKVLLENVRVNGRPLTVADVKTNEFARQVTVRP